MKPSKSILKDKSYSFALDIIKEYKILQNNHKEYVLSRQFLRSGTSIGAMIREAEFAESRRDFIHKMRVALKEANEIGYWLDLLHESNYLKVSVYKRLSAESVELIAMLISSVKTAAKRK